MMQTELTVAVFFSVLLPKKGKKNKVLSMITSHPSKLPKTLRTKTRTLSQKTAKRMQNKQKLK